MKRVVITGATGFVGVNLARRLLRQGHEVHLLARVGYTTWRVQAIRDEVCLHELDLADHESLGLAIDRIRPDWVFHLASNGAYSWETNTRRMTQVNLLGTINMVEACLKTGFEAFVNTGSSSEYGFKDHAPSETEWLEPNSCYAVTKASATLYCRYTAQSLGVRMPTLRLYSVYGPYEDPGRFVPALVLQGLKGEFPPLANAGVVRDFVYVDDVSEAYLLAATQSNQEVGAVYNIGTGVQTSLRQAVDIARNLMGVSAEPAWGSMSDRMWDTNVWVCDNRKARRELGWTPRHTFEDGLGKTVEWFRGNPELLDYYYHRYAQAR